MQLTVHTTERFAVGLVTQATRDGTQSMNFGHQPYLHALSTRHPLPDRWYLQGRTPAVDGGACASPPYMLQCVPNDSHRLEYKKASAAGADVIVRKVLSRLLTLVNSDDAGCDLVLGVSGGCEAVITTTSDTAAPASRLPFVTGIPFAGTPKDFAAHITKGLNNVLCHVWPPLPNACVAVSVTRVAFGGEAVATTYGSPPPDSDVGTDGLLAQGEAAGGICVAQQAELDGDEQPRPVFAFAAGRGLPCGWRAVDSEALRDTLQRAVVTVHVTHLADVRRGALSYPWIELDCRTDPKRLGVRRVGALGRQYSHIEGTIQRIEPNSASLVRDGPQPNLDGHPMDIWSRIRPPNSYRAVVALESDATSAMWRIGDIGLCNAVKPRSQWNGTLSNGESWDAAFVSAARSVANRTSMWAFVTETTDAAATVWVGWSSTRAEQLRVSVSVVVVATTATAALACARACPASPHVTVVDVLLCDYVPQLPAGDRLEIRVPGVAGASAHTPMPRADEVRQWLTQKLPLALAVHKVAVETAQFNRAASWLRHALPSISDRYTPAFCDFNDYHTPAFCHLSLAKALPCCGATTLLLQLWAYLGRFSRASARWTSQWCHVADLDVHALLEACSHESTALVLFCDEDVAGVADRLKHAWEDYPQGQRRDVVVVTVTEGVPTHSDSKQFVVSPYLASCREAEAIADVFVSGLQLERDGAKARAVRRAAANVGAHSRDSLLFNLCVAAITGVVGINKLVAWAISGGATNDASKPTMVALAFLVTFARRGHRSLHLREEDCKRLQATNLQHLCIHPCENSRSTALWHPCLAEPLLQWACKGWHLQSPKVLLSVLDEALTFAVACYPPGGCQWHSVAALATSILIAPNPAKQVGPLYTPFVKRLLQEWRHGVQKSCEPDFITNRVAELTAIAPTGDQRRANAMTHMALLESRLWRHLGSMSFTRSSTRCVGANPTTFWANATAAASKALDMARASGGDVTPFRAALACAEVCDGS